MGEDMWIGEWRNAAMCGSGWEGGWVGGCVERICRQMGVLGWVRGGGEVWVEGGEGG